VSINLHLGDFTVDVQAKIGFREQKVGLICINVRVTDNIKCLTQCCVLLKITVYKNMCGVLMRHCQVVTKN